MTKRRSCVNDVALLLAINAGLSMFNKIIENDMGIKPICGGRQSCKYVQELLCENHKLVEKLDKIHEVSDLE